MSFRNDRFEYRLATPGDSEQLLRIYESGDFKGNISVLFTRRPDPYQSLMNEGENAVIPVIEDKERGILCAAGCCIIRKAHVNGEVKRTGYLTGLKVLPEYRRRMPHIADVYRYLHEQTKEHADIYYTTILNENTQAQKLLEKKRSNMPLYKYIGEYTVHCFRTGIRQKPKKYIFEKGNVNGLDAFYEPLMKDFQFSPIRIDLHGAAKEDIYTLRDIEGDLLAACAVWNQQSYKQYIITGYSGIYKYLQRFPLKILGYPSLPKENMPANYASVAMLCVKDKNMELAEYFMKRVAESASEYDFLMLGLFENHPLMNIFHKVKHIKYKSRLYTVHWDDSTMALDNRPIHLEVGLL
jgi:ribosomal protein S18 acetylase RimI-like enzyme